MLYCHHVWHAPYCFHCAFCQSGLLNTGVLLKSEDSLMLAKSGAVLQLRTHTQLNQRPE